MYIYVYMVLVYKISYFHLTLIINHYFMIHKDIITNSLDCFFLGENTFFQFKIHDNWTYVSVSKLHISRT